MSEIDLLSVGRAAVDLYGAEIGTPLEDVQSFEKSLGGSPANVAVGASRLGLKVAMLTRVGDEHMGRFVRQTLAREGVDVSQVVTDPERLTALVLLSIRDKDTFPLIFYRTDCADMALCEDDVDPAFVAKVGVLHLTGTHLSTPKVDAACRKAIRAAKAAGVRVVLDVDYRPVLWGLTGHGLGEERYVESGRVTEHLMTVLPDCDLIVGTEEEIQIAGGHTEPLAALRSIRAVSDATIVMKRGPLGCVVYEGEIGDSVEDGFVSTGAEVEVLNVLGAGDAFLAGFLSGWAKRAPIADCCRRANAAGALVVSRHACAPAMPTAAELEDYLARAADVRRIDRDERIAVLHRTTTRRSMPDSLCVLAFDHRTKLAALTSDTRRLERLKVLIAEAATAGEADGMIVDSRFGREVLDRFTGRCWLARPIEAPGPELAFVGAPNVELQLRRWSRHHVVKCLVRDPLQASERQARQDAQIVRLAGACASLDRALMLEILPLDDDGQLHESAAPAAMTRLYELGVRPELWKLAAPDDAGWWAEVEAVIDRFDPHCQGVMMLGFDRPPDELGRAMATGRRSRRCRGFAVGRTIFFAAAKRWLEGEIDDATLVEEVESRFVDLVRRYEGSGAWSR